MTQAAPKSDVREKLVETAGRLFYTQGFNATGINQIIAEADIAKASFYHHFQSKEDLLVAYLEQRHHQDLAALRQLVAKAATPFEQLATAFEGLRSYLQQGEFRGCAFGNVMAEFPNKEHIVHNVIGWHEEGIRQLLGEIAASALRNKNLSADQVRERADRIYLVFHGAMKLCQIHKQCWAISTARNMAMEILDAK